MAHEALQAYLDVLGPYCGLPLTVDSHGVCRLFLREDLKCQCEADLAGGFQATAVLGTLPAGRFKQNALMAALEWNGGSPPPSCVLAFSQKHAALILQLLLPAGVEAAILEKDFTHFLEQCILWHDALRAGGGYPESPRSLSPRTLPSAAELHRKKE